MIKFNLHIVLIAVWAVSCNLCIAQTTADAATSIGQALIQINSNNASAARGVLQDMESSLALAGFKSVIKTSPTLFQDESILFEAVDDIIRHGGAHDPELANFFRKHENNSRVRSLIREALDGIPQGSDPEAAAKAAKVLQSPTATALEKTQAMLQMRNFPDLVRQNMRIVRGLAITPSSEILTRRSAIAGLINADDWRYLIDNYNKTDSLGKRLIISGLSQFVASKGFPSTISNAKDREALAGIFQVAALEKDSTIKQEDAVRGLMYLVSKSRFETATKDDISTGIVATLRKVRTDSNSTASRHMADLIIGKLPAP